MSRMIQQHKRKDAAGTDPFITDRDLDIEEVNTADVRVAGRKKRANSKGRYVTLIQTPNNKLEIVPNPSMIAEFVDENRDHLPTDVLTALEGFETPGERRYNVWGDDQTLYELMEDFLTNGWQNVPPEDIGALTSAPIFEAPDGRIYWHERYQVESAAEELLLGKTVKFDGAPENKAPSAKVAPEGDEADEKEGKTSAKEAASAKTAFEDNPTLDADPMDDDAPPPAAPPPAPPPARPPANMFEKWQTQNLIETIEQLTDSDSFATDKPEQKSVELMAEVLSARPVERDTEDAKQAAVKMAKTALLRVRPRGLEAAVKSAAGMDEGAAKSDEDKPEEESKTASNDDDDDDAGHPFLQSVTDGVQALAPLAEMALASKKQAGQGAPPQDGDTGKHLEGDTSIPRGADFDEDHTGIPDVPTTLPKEATVPTTGSALKTTETIIDKLKALYLEAKPITGVNGTRPVREGIEAIYHAMQAMGQSQKVLAKQLQQEDFDADTMAAKEKAKKKGASLLLNLRLAAPDDV